MANFFSNVKKLTTFLLFLIIWSVILGGGVYFWQDVTKENAIDKEVDLVTDELGEKVNELEEDLEICRTEKDNLTLELMGDLRDNVDPIESEVSSTDVDSMLASASEINSKIIECVNASKPLKKPQNLTYGGSAICNISEAALWPELVAEYEYRDVQSNIDRQTWSFSIYNSTVEAEVISCSQDGCSKI